MVAQPGNRDWVTVIEGVNSTGWAIPPKIIYQGQKHQASWYKAGAPGDWFIGVSPKGWTDDDHGYHWLTTIFEPATRDQTKGVYRLLVLDGHGSHHTPAFDRFCEEKNIKVLPMPPHSSHRLQPLDVSYFSVLKLAYGDLVQELLFAGTNHIDKTLFMELFIKARARALTPANIQAGFAGAGLYLFNPGRVLAKLPSVPKEPQIRYIIRIPASLRIRHLVLDLAQACLRPHTT